MQALCVGTVRVGSYPHWQCWYRYRYRYRYRRYCAALQGVRVRAARAVPGIVFGLQVCHVRAGALLARTASVSA